MEFGRRSFFYVVTKVIGWIIQILSYVDISCNGAKMYLVISFFPDLCFRYLVLNVSPDVVDIGEFCCLFVVYIYVRLVMSSYPLFCCIYFDAWCITCCPNSRGLHRVITLFCYNYFDDVSHAVQNEKKLWKFTPSDR